MSQRSHSGGLLKLVFLFHLVLSAWGMQSAFTIPTSYLYSNIVFMFVLAWAIGSSRTNESIAMAFLVNLTVFVLDIITLTLYWPSGDRHRLYMGFAIANTILRPLTSLLFYRIFNERDVDGIGFRGLFSDIIDSPLSQQQGGPGYRDDGRSLLAFNARQGYEPINGNQPPPPPFVPGHVTSNMSSKTGEPGIGMQLHFEPMPPGRV